MYRTNFSDGHRSGAYVFENYEYFTYRNLDCLRLHKVKAKQKFEYHAYFPEISIINFEKKIDVIAKIEIEPDWCKKSNIDVDKEIQELEKKKISFWKKLFHVNSTK